MYSFSRFSTPSLGTRPARHGSQNRRPGFTLIELLVVVAIIALLIGILLPALGKAKESAKVALNLSNLHQMGLGVGFYLNDSKGYYFPHEGNYLANHQIVDRSPSALGETVPAFSDSQSLVDAISAGNVGLAVPFITLANATATQRRAHWVDYIYPYASEPKIYTSPMVERQELEELNLSLVAENVYGKVKWGGYGYNQHFMGWEATLTTGAVTTPAYSAKTDKEIKVPSDTVLAGDSAGSRNTATKRGNSYCLEGPLPSDTLGRKIQKFYKSAAAASSGASSAMAEEAALIEQPGTDKWLFRCYPAPRNNGAPGFIFADGHAGVKKLSEIDDYNGDGVFDDGYWNGKADPDPASR